MIEDQVLVTDRTHKSRPFHGSRSRLIETPNKAPVTTRTIQIGEDNGMIVIASSPRD